MGILSITAAQATNLISSWGTVATLGLVTAGGILLKFKQLIGQIEDLKSVVESHTKQIAGISAKPGIDRTQGKQEGK